MYFVNPPRVGGQGTVTLMAATEVVPSTKLADEASVIEAEIWLQACDFK
jgi:hypothetical protein